MPNYFKKDWIEDWKRERQLGVVNWVLLHGAAFLIIASLVDAFVNDRAIWKMELLPALTHAAIYILGGLAYGGFTWWFNERKLKKIS